MERTIRLISTLMLIGTVSGLATACRTPLKQHWGESVRHNVNAMVANPEAGKTTAKPLEGLDPVTAELVSETYKANQRQDKSDEKQLFLITQ